MVFNFQVLIESMECKLGEKFISLIYLIDIKITVVMVRSWHFKIINRLCSSCGGAVPSIVPLSYGKDKLQLTV